MEITYPLSKESLIELYLNQKLSDLKIGKLFGKSGGTIASHRRKFGIKTIECWERFNVPRELSQMEKEVIFGYLLGDGTMLFACKQACLRVSQSKKQESFVIQMYEYLNQWTAYEPVDDAHLDKRFNKTYYAYRFDTVSHPVFTEIRKMCYPNGIKRVSRTWLDNVGPIGLALWYEGDGSLEGEIIPTLKTNSFSEEEHDIIIKWFDDCFNIKSCKINRSGYLNICIKSAMEFREIIEPYIIPYFSN